MTSRFPGGTRPAVVAAQGTGAARPGTATALLTLAMLVLVLAAACSSGSSEPSASGARSVADVIAADGDGIAPDTGAEGSSTGTTADEDTASPSATRPSTLEAELPPEAADEGEPIEDNVGTTAAFGLFDVCSLYDAARLSELLGGFWPLEEGVSSEQQCLWLAPPDTESGAVVSIEVAPTFDPDDPGSAVDSDGGEGLRFTADGTEFVVNVVTNELDPDLGSLNGEEAERRIADDLFERLTGEPRTDG